MSVAATKSASGNEWLSCRDVLWYLSFCGFAIDYILRINLSLTIVAMVAPRPEFVVTAQCTQDIPPTIRPNLSDLSVNTSSPTDVEENTVIPSLGLAESQKTGSSINHTEYPDRFSWNEYEQGLALGGYYWMHWAMQLPGGVLARRYGTKLVFGLANFIPALLGFFIPLFARYHLYAFVFIRVLQGALAGAAWPAMHNMTAKWIPFGERSKFVSSYLGSSVGAAITYPISAMLINWLRWESVFYVTSALGVICEVFTFSRYVAWYYLAYDRPQDHPRISEAEKAYILESLGETVSHDDSQTVPWKAILTSRPLWLITIAECGNAWGVFTLNSEAPSYLNYIHGWNISAAGLLSAAPHMMRMLFAFVFSSFADWLLRTRRMSTTRLRKFAILVCNGVQSIMLLGLAFSGCHPILAAAFMIAGMTAAGANSAGTLACTVDLSPNHASVLLGITNTVATSSGFISPMIVGILTNNNQTIDQWRLVFLITVAIMFSTGALYILFGVAELQPWNNTRNEEVGEELQKLRGSDVDKVECGKTTNAIS
ncbi:sialin [Diprion similis]|uniref:sialin n=1 Tax=Diprion similis TaxID=362088 RepID=UPI001EF7BA90|nr:sialin [Diprion similis]